MTSLLLDDDEELLAYTNASKISKKKFTKEVLGILSAEDFDWVGFAHLLSQDDDGGNEPNPLHAYFARKSIDAARSFVKANELVEQFMVSTRTESSSVLSVDTEELTEEEMKQLTKENE